MMVLAEIADKMPTVEGWTKAGCVIALVALGLGLLRRWLVLAPLPIIAFCDWAMWGILREDEFLQAMIHECGWQYVVGWFAGWNLPFLAAATIVALCPRRYAMSGHCEKCGYDLTGNVSGRCPECGTPVTGVAE